MFPTVHLYAKHLIKYKFKDLNLTNTNGIERASKQSENKSLKWW